MQFICRVRLIPNTYEMVYTYSKEYDNESSMRPWPDWIVQITNVREARRTSALGVKWNSRNLDCIVLTSPKPRMLSLPHVLLL